MRAGWGVVHAAAGILVPTWRRSGRAAYCNLAFRAYEKTGGHLSADTLLLFNLPVRPILPPSLLPVFVGGRRSIGSWRRVFPPFAGCNWFPPPLCSVCISLSITHLVTAVGFLRFRVAPLILCALIIPREMGVDLRFGALGVEIGSLLQNGFWGKGR